MCAAIKLAQSLVSPPPLGEVPPQGAERAIAGSRPSFWEATFLALRRPGKTLRCFPSFFPALRAHKGKGKVAAF